MEPEILEDPTQNTQNQGPDAVDLEINKARGQKLKKYKEKKYYRVVVNIPANTGCGCTAGFNDIIMEASSPSQIELNIANMMPIGSEVVMIELIKTIIFTGPYDY